MRLRNTYLSAPTRSFMASSRYAAFWRSVFYRRQQLPFRDLIPYRNSDRRKPACARRADRDFHLHGFDDQHGLLEHDGFVDVLLDKHDAARQFGNQLRFHNEPLLDFSGLTSKAVPGLRRPISIRA